MDRLPNIFVLFILAGIVPVVLGFIGNIVLGALGLYGEAKRAVQEAKPPGESTASYKLEVEYRADGTVKRVKLPGCDWSEGFTSDTLNGDGTRTLKTADGRELRVPARRS